MSLADDFGADERDPDAPAVPFTEDQALAWVKDNPDTSIRMASKLWGWSVGKVQRFLERVQTDSPKPSESAESVKTDSPTDSPRTESPKTDSPDSPDSPVRSFDFERSKILLSPRTGIAAYVDDNGDLRILAEDMGEAGPVEVRINREDIEAFLCGLNAIWEKAKERRL